jgi:hypothetical protein
MKGDAMISFNVTRKESEIINKIANRAVALYLSAGEPVSKMGITMDLEATHANGNPLKLSALLAADDFDFAHDVFGIRRHLDRETGKLGGCFSPRFSA